MNTPYTLSNVERQQQLYALLISQQRITVPEICKYFSISEATARRDLEQLSEKGLLQRVHGGAIPVRRAAPELPIMDRDREQSEEKCLIGKAAAALVNDGDTIFLGSGTTVLEVARNLLEKSELTVITNSLPVINTLVGFSKISIIVLGGILRDSELSFIGHITEQALSEVRADKVILGTRALHLEHGLTNDYLPETLTDRAILRSGREIIVVADHTKFGCVSTAFLAPLSNINKIVTDRRIPQEILAALNEMMIQVILA